MVTTDLGNEFATLDRELPEAVRRTKRPEDRNGTAMVDRGIQTLKKDGAQGRAVERPLGAGGHIQRPAARPPSSGCCRTTPTSSSTTRTSRTGA